MAKQANVISHWHQLIENFQTSSMAFYEGVEKGLVERAVPDARGARVEHKEGGLASAYRVYLRIHRGKYAFDICAAPFSTGFFVSWWFTEPPLAFALLYTLGFLFCLMFAFNIAYFIGVAIGVATMGFLGVFFEFAFAGVPIALWVLGNAIRQRQIGGESTVLAMPLISRIYERIFAPTTFYSMDTALMFQDAVHNAVLEVIDCMTQEKGIRALSEAESKPVLKSLAASA